MKINMKTCNLIEYHKTLFSLDYFYKANLLIKQEFQKIYVKKHCPEMTADFDQIG